MTETSSPPCLSAEDLARLADWLRSQGFRPATQQCVWAQHLLVRLALEGRLPADPRDLAPHLGPIFCGTPEQQRRFSSVYAEWLTTRFALPPTHSLPAPEPDRSRLRQRRWFPWAVGGIAFSIIALLGWNLDRSRLRVLPGTVTVNGGPPPPGTVQWTGEQIKKETPYDAKGNFTLGYSRRELPLKVSVAAKDFTAPSQELRWPVPDRMTFALTYVEPGVARDRVVPPPPPTNTPPSSSLDVQLVRVIQWPQPIDWPRYLLAASPLVLLGAWLAWSHWRRQPALQRRLSQTPPNLKEIHLSGGVRYLLPGLGVRQLARELRRRRIIASRELDTAATLHASLRRGGLFTPVFGSRAEPDYLVLIDRASFADHQARLADEIVLTLQFGDVSIERFYYHGDPRRCQREALNSANSGIETFTLTELAARFPEHRVLVFSDGTGFFDRFTGEPVPWLVQLGGWSEKVVLTPESPAHWGRREWAIEKLGFTLLPLSRAGIGLLGDLFRDRPRPTFSTSATAIAATPLFATEPTRWLERHPPRPEIVEQLCTELRAHLGSAGFQWLAACAVYPEVHWGLTVRLGSSLPGCAHQFEALLPRLARLVWLRECYLPDWLRAKLLAALNLATQQQVRLLLQELLTQTVVTPDVDLSLQIAVSKPADQPGWWQRLRALGARRKSARTLGAAARTSEPGSPLRDYVFLRFLSGEDAAQLTVKAPPLLLRLLFPQGVRWFGIRRTVGVAGGVMVAIALFAVGGTDFLAFPKSVAIAPDNGTIAGGGTDGSIRFWNLADGLRIGSPLWQRGFVHSVAFSPDGTRLVSASDGEAARIWRAAADSGTAGKPANAPRPSSTAVSVGDPVTFTAPATSTTPAMYQWSKDDRPIPGANASRFTINSVTAADAGSYNVIVTNSSGSTMSTAETLTVVPPGTSAPAPVNLSLPTAVPSSNASMTAGSVDSARIWGTVPSQARGVPLPDVVTSAAFSPDGTRVVTAGFDTIVRIFDSATGQPIGSPLEHAGMANRAIFSPDSTRVATVSRQSAGDTVQIWDAATQQPRGLPWLTRGRLINAAFNRDGTRVVTVTGDGTQMWDATTGQLIGPPLPYQDMGEYAAFSPDGTRVVTINDTTTREWDGTRVVTNTTTRIWDTTTGQSIGLALPNQSIRVTSAAFSPDGSRVVTASGEGKIHVWSIAPSASSQPQALLIGCNYPTRTGQTVGLAGALNNVARRINPSSLANPVRDMRALEKILTENYGFAVTMLEDPTLEQIHAAFRSEAVQSASGTFVLALAGHGIGDAKSGFAFPLDAEVKTPGFTQPEIERFLNSLPSRQALVIVDASEGHRLIDSSPANTINGSRTRRVLAASSQKTPYPSDGTPGKGSPFVLAVLEALTAARRSLSGQQLFEDTERSLAAQKEAQKPSYGPIKPSGRNSGDFQFPPRVDDKSQAGQSSAPKSIEARVKEVVLESLGVEENLVKPEASFAAEMGADNQDMAELIRAFEVEFKRELSGNIPAADVARLRTVGDVINYMRSRTTKQQAR